MRISVVTISYNQAIYLPALIASVAEQLAGEDEHIIVDPGSSDDSRNIIIQSAGRDHRIRPLFQPDSGPADGLNHGFACATGDIFYYLNADDLLLKGAFIFARSFFSRHSKTDILLGAIKLATADGQLFLRGRIPDAPTANRLRCKAFQYYQQGTFFRRSAFEAVSGFNPENRSCWDRELVVDMFIAGQIFSVTSRPMGVFRLQPNSITSAGISSRYITDNQKIIAKITAATGQDSRLLRQWYRLEARANPIRWLKQLRPAP